MEINGLYGLWLHESPGNGPPRRFGEFGESQIVERFPKNPRMRKVGGVLYNCVVAPRNSTFATLPFHLPSQPSRFQIRIHTRFRHQSQTRSERWRRRRELVTQRRRAPESAVMKSGCRRAWGRQSSTGWWRRVFYLTASPPEGG